jgi:hypothetical protein
MNDPRIPALLVSHHRPGFYFRVLEEGEVQAGDDIVKLCSGPEQMTVADVDALLCLPGHTRQGLLRALRIPALSPGWLGSFRALLDEEPGSGNAGLSATSPPPAWLSRPPRSPRKTCACSQARARRLCVRGVCRPGIAQGADGRDQPHRPSRCSGFDQRPDGG